MTRAPNVRLSVSNLPENVSLVREILAGLAGALPLEDGQLDDVKTVVSEACNNVVIHAYDGGRGPLDVEIRVADGELVIAVRDRGGGLRPRPASDGEVEGIGIPVIRALSDRVEFTGAVGRGTVVQMYFDVPGARRFASQREADAHADAEALEFGAPRDACDPAFTVTPGGGAPAPDTEVRVTLDVAPLSLARSVLSRPLTALAARARFSIDRLSDVQLVTDAITAHAGRSLTTGRLQVSVLLSTRDLELRVGPLRSGMARQLISDTAVGGLEPLIETLADEVTIESIGDSDVLTLRMLDPR